MPETLSSIEMKSFQNTIDSFENTHYMHFEFKKVEGGKYRLIVNSIEFNEDFSTLNGLSEVINLTDDIMSIYIKNQNFGKKFYIGTEDFDGHVKYSIQLDDNKFLGNKIDFLDTKYLTGSKGEDIFGRNNGMLEKYVLFLNQIVEKMGN